MNNIRQIQELNQKELDAGIPPSASWHTDFSDSAFVYIGGLPFTLTEGDILTIFSQYGHPTFINLIRDSETGKSKGFCFLKYADQRSTALAVDNLGGAEILGRIIRVDHTRYKPKEGKDGKVEGMWVDQDDEEEEEDSEEERERERERSPPLKEEVELRKLIEEMDEEDPMKEYMVEEKRKEVAEAREKREREKKKERSREKDKDRKKREHRSSRRERSGERKRSRERSPRAIKERGEGERHRDRSREMGSGRDREKRRERDEERRRPRSPRERKEREGRRDRSRDRGGEDGRKDRERRSRRPEEGEERSHRREERRHRHRSRSP